MRTRWLALLIIALGVSSLLMAQPSPGTPKKTTPGKNIEKQIIVRGGTMGMRAEMGRWWRDGEISKKLQLSDGQITQLDEIFYDHRVKLIDYGAEMEKQDLKLQALLDADTPNEGQIGSQVDSVLAARGKLEREYTFMNLDLRKVLSLDQWRQLKSVRGERGGGDVIYFHKKLHGSPQSGPVTLPFPPGDEVELAVPPPDPTL